MNPQRLTIYHTNDLHNCVGILQNLSKVKENGSTLLLDAGDAIGGSSTLFKFKEKNIDKMNAAGYDAVAMGNRELNYLRWVLKIRSQQASFPILSANLEDTLGRSEGFFHSHIIKNTDGLKVGIFGLTPVQYKDDSFWFSLFKLRFNDPLETAKKMVKKLAEETHLIILLSHLGINQDKFIAENVDGIHLIIGGHSHTLIEKPLQINGAYIFQAGSHGRAAGKIDLIATPHANPPIKELKYQFMRV